MLGCRVTSLFRLFIAAVLAVCASAAQAHPHVWVTYKSEVVFAPDGRVTGVRHAWTFDDQFSAFATLNLPAKEKGQFTREELAPLAEVNVTSLKDFEYFTYVTADGQKLELEDPSKGEYWLDYKDATLTLNFTLPLKAPVKAREISVEVYDPTIFVDFSPAKKDAAALAGAPQGCKLNVLSAREMTFEEGKRLSQIPADQQNIGMAWGAQFAGKIKVTCP
jgi:ABC-type uncharacterized transport system substrate-binding protein